MDLIKQELTPKEIFSENGLDPILEKIKQKADNFQASCEADVNTEPGRKEIRSFAYKIAQSKTFIDNAGKLLVTDQKKAIKKVDAERKRARDFLDDLKEQVRGPVTRWDGEQKAKVAAELLKRQIEQSHEEALEDNVQFDLRKENERKQAELDEYQRRIDEEKEAVALERKKLEDDKNAEADRKMRERHPEQIVVEAKKKAEADAKADAKANIEHRRNINNEALAGVNALGATDGFGRKVITAIIENKIPHVTINY